MDTHVRVNDDYYSKRLRGRVGTIVERSVAGTAIVRVKFDGFTNGHGPDRNEWALCPDEYTEVECKPTTA